MNVRRLVPAVALVALLGACEARFGNDAGEVSENATAAGRAEAGRFTVEAPGFNLSVNIPEGIRAQAGIDEDNGLVYPGATFEGLHVQGRRDGGDGEGGEVEMRFATSAALPQVVAWYRDPARGTEININTAQRQGAGFVIAGTRRGENDRFSVTLQPRQGGGTEARLLLSDAR